MRVFIVIVLGALIALVGVRVAAVEPGGVDLLLSIVIGCVLAMSCSADARRLKRPLPSIADFAIYGLWPVAVPIYLLWSRGFRKGGLLALGFTVAVLGIFVIAYAITYNAMWGDV